MGKSSLHDELLVLRCQEGDAQAFSRLVDRWQERLARHAYRLTGSEDAVADVLQESWMAIIKGLPGLDDAEAFPKWAFRIVTNKCGDWVRHRRRGRRLADELERQAARTKDDPGGPSPAADSLGEALAALSGEDRALLSQYYVEGFGLAEIAQIMGLPEGTVKSRLYHARQRLRQGMKEEDND